MFILKAKILIIIKKILILCGFFISINFVEAQASGISGAKLLAPDAGEVPIGIIIFVLSSIVIENASIKDLVALLNSR
jgi:hypothetical protein